MSGQRVFDRLFAYGGRSFSIYTNDGHQVYDSANDFESIIANKVGAGELPQQAFNATHNNNSAGQVRARRPTPSTAAATTRARSRKAWSWDASSDRVYAFIGLERIGGVMVYDVTEPNNAFYVSYVNNRNFRGRLHRGYGGPHAAQLAQRWACSNDLPNPLALDLGPKAWPSCRRGSARTAGRC